MWNIGEMMLPTTKEDILKLLKDNEVDGFKDTIAFFTDVAKYKRLNGQDITYDWMVAVKPAIIEIIEDEMHKLEMEQPPQAAPPNQNL